MVRVGVRVRVSGQGTVGEEVVAAHVIGHAKVILEGDSGRSFAGATSTHSPQSSEASIPTGLSKAEVPT